MKSFSIKIDLMTSSFIFSMMTAPSESKSPERELHSYEKTEIAAPMSYNTAQDRQIVRIGL